MAGITGSDAYGALIAYIDATLKGAGALKGKDGANCKIDSIITVGNSVIVTFKWTDDDGTEKTSSMTIHDGKSAYELAVASGYVGTLEEWLASLKGDKGDRGYSFASITFNADGNMIVTLDDEAGTQLAPVPMPPAKVEISKETGNVLEPKPDGLYVPKGAVEISKAENNAIEPKADGLFVPKPADQEQSDWLQTDATQPDYIKNKPTVRGVSADEDNALTLGTDGGLFVPTPEEPEPQADWSQTDTTQPDYIKNKPEIATEFSDEPSDANVPSEKLVKANIVRLDGKINSIELFKFPNAIIHGEPVINNGQISGFSAVNYLAFPFLVDFSNREFVIDMAFTTGSDVTSQQNIIDGKFGLALAIQNGHFILAVSTNGSSWDVGVMPGSHAVQPNANYYLKLTYDHVNYKLAYSLDGVTFIDDITHASASSPYPVQVYIGVGDLDVVGSEKPFKGIINMNKSYLTIGGQIVWQGMDDAGLASRMSTDMENIDELGKANLKKIAETDKKVDKVTGKSLINDTELERLSKVANMNAVTAFDDAVPAVGATENFLVRGTIEGLSTYWCIQSTFWNVTDSDQRRGAQIAYTIDGAENRLYMRPFYAHDEDKSVIEFGTWLRVARSNDLMRVNGQELIVGITDFNDATPQYTYTTNEYMMDYSTYGSLVNAPSEEVTHWYLTSSRKDGECNQIAYASHSHRIYTRWTTNVGSADAWSSWAELAYQEQFNLKYYNSAATQNLDCNNITDFDCLVTANADNYSALHYPIRDLLYITTHRNVDDAYQEARTYSGDCTYVRSMINNVWYPWHEIAQYEKLNFVIKPEAEPTIYSYTCARLGKVVFFNVLFAIKNTISANEVVFNISRGDNLLALDGRADTNLCGYGNDTVYPIYSLDTTSFKVNSRDLPANTYLASGFVTIK